MAVRVFDDFLCDSAAASLLLNFVETTICPITTDKQQCDGVAEAFIPVAIDWFRMATTPAQLCSSVGVCGSRILQDAKYNKPRLLPRQSSLECPMCEYVVTGLQQIFKDPQRADSIEKAAEEICSHLPASVSPGCKDFVDTYEPVVVMYLEAVNASTACALLGACPASLALRHPPALTPGLVKGLSGPVTLLQALSGSESTLQGKLCDVCKDSVAQAHDLVLDPDMQLDLADYAKKICDQVVPASADVCKGLIDAYAPLVWDQLAKVLVPDTICQGARVCPAATVWQSVLGAIRVNPLLFATAMRFPH